MPQTAHSILPALLTRAVDDVLAAAGVSQVAHGDAHPQSAAGVAAQDPDAVVLIGPLRSLDVVELNPFLDERGRSARVLVELVASLFGRRILDRPTSPIEAVHTEQS